MAHVCRESVERLEWVEAHGGRRRDVFRGRLRASVAGDACPGVRVVRGHGDPGEAPEGHLVNHTIAVNVASLVHCDFSWAGGRWVRQPVAPMALHVLPAGIPYASRWDEPFEFVAVQISPDHLAAAGAQLGNDRVELRPSTAVEDRFLAHAALALVEEVGAEEPGGRMCGESLAAALVLHLLRAHARLRPPVHPQRALTSTQLTRVLGHIAANLGANLSLGELAALVQMDVFRFVRSFKQSVGLPPHQYLLRARIERAKGLLGDAALSISEVALSTGFATPSHFATTFRRMTRTTPRGYRESLR